MHAIAEMNERRAENASDHNDCYGYLQGSRGLFADSIIERACIVDHPYCFDEHIEYTVLPYKVFRAINKAIPLYRRRWILFCQLNFK